MVDTRSQRNPGLSDLLLECALQTEESPAHDANNSPFPEQVRLRKRPGQRVRNHGKNEEGEGRDAGARPENPPPAPNRSPTLGDPAAQFDGGRLPRGTLLENQTKSLEGLETGTAAGTPGKVRADVPAIGCGKLVIEITVQQETGFDAVHLPSQTRETAPIFRQD
jgi:hypothetical protein